MGNIRGAFRLLDTASCVMPGSAVAHVKGPHIDIEVAKEKVQDTGRVGHMLQHPQCSSRLIGAIPFLYLPKALEGRWQGAEVSGLVSEAILVKEGDLAGVTNGIKVVKDCHD